MYKLFFTVVFLTAICLILWSYNVREVKRAVSIPSVQAVRRDFEVQIKTVGELEAAQSIVIASSIKGDQGKIVDLIPEGVYVEPGQTLVRMDATPFEEKIDKLRSRIKEQEVYVHALDQALTWESCQADHENRSALYETESAQLELEKIIQGDGPQEIHRLKNAMQKAWVRYDELGAYANDLLQLETEGFLNPSEVKQAQKKLFDEQEAYESAKQQYETYLQHVYPMLVKKGETALKRAEIHREEVAKSGLYREAKAAAQLEQSKQGLEDLLLQLKDAELEFSQTEIVAPAPGMVVHREDYRSGQRRKPRVGDILIKNQPLIELPDLSSMVVKTQVREIDLYKIDAGRKATIQVDAYPHLIFRGTIASIGVLALSDIGRASEEKFFEVRIALDASAPCLRPGMTARTTIHALEAKDVVAIPVHAVFHADEGSFCYVQLPDHSFETRSVTLGMSNDQWVEVQDGIQEKETVCLLNPYCYD